MGFIGRGFRDIRINDLSDTSKSPVDIEQATGIQHSGEPEEEERFYEDSTQPGVTIEKKFSGDITLTGDLEKYCWATWVAGVRTPQLFEKGHYFLIRCLVIDANPVSEGKMVYCRWIGQLVSVPTQAREAAELAESEVVFKITQYGDKSFVVEEPYIATADGDPGPIDPAPSADYDPLFTAFTDDTTKTIAAAEIEVGSPTNPE